MQMSIAETATVLGKSERQVRYLIHRGKLQATKDPDRVIPQRRGQGVLAPASDVLQHTVDTG